MVFAEFRCIILLNKEAMIACKSGKNCTCCAVAASEISK